MAKELRACRASLAPLTEGFVPDRLADGAGLRAPNHWPAA